MISTVVHNVILYLCHAMTQVDLRKLNKGDFIQILFIEVIQPCMASAVIFLLILLLDPVDQK